MLSVNNNLLEESPIKETNIFSVSSAFLSHGIVKCKVKASIKLSKDTSATCSPTLWVCLLSGFSVSHLIRVVLQYGYDLCEKEAALFDRFIFRNSDFWSFTFKYSEPRFQEQARKLM